MLPPIHRRSGPSVCGFHSCFYPPSRPGLARAHTPTTMPQAPAKMSIQEPVKTPGQGHYDDENEIQRIRTVGSINMSAEMFEKLYLSPKNAVKGELRKTFGNPTPMYVLGCSPCSRNHLTELQQWPRGLHPCPDAPRLRPYGLAWRWRERCCGNVSFAFTLY